MAVETAGLRIYTIGFGEVHIWVDPLIHSLEPNKSILYFASGPHLAFSFGEASVHYNKEHAYDQKLWESERKSVTKIGTTSLFTFLENGEIRYRVVLPEDGLDIHIEIVGFGEQIIRGLRLRRAIHNSLV